MESKREKFTRLAESRVNNALKQIQLIGNLSDTRTYEYSKADVDAILKALKTAVTDLEHSFNKSERGKRFSLTKGNK